MTSPLFSLLLSLSRLPNENRPSWLESAEKGVDFFSNVLNNSDEIILYASVLIEKFI